MATRIGGMLKFQRFSTSQQFSPYKFNPVQPIVAPSRSFFSTAVSSGTRHALSSTGFLNRPALFNVNNYEREPSKHQFLYRHFSTDSSPPSTSSSTTKSLV